MAGGSVNGMLLGAVQDALHRRMQRGMHYDQMEMEKARMAQQEASSERAQESMRDRLGQQLAAQAAKQHADIESKFGIRDIGHQEALAKLNQRNDALEKTLEQRRSESDDRNARTEARLAQAAKLAADADKRARDLADQLNKTHLTIAQLNNLRKQHSDALKQKQAADQLESKAKFEVLHNSMKGVDETEKAQAKLENENVGMPADMVKKQRDALAKQRAEHQAKANDAVRDILKRQFPEPQQPDPAGFMGGPPK